MTNDGQRAPVLGVAVIEECLAWRDVPGLESAIVAAATCAFVRAAGTAGQTAGRGEIAPAAEIAIALLSDAQVRALNRDFRGQDKPTNVLSFPQTTAIAPTAHAPRALGDLALAYETTAREASEADIGIADHVRHLVVHGVLHLLGHDHVDDEEALVMEGLEIEVLAALGVANPYACRDDAETAEIVVAGSTSR